MRAEAVGLAKDKAKEFANNVQRRLFSSIRKSIFRRGAQPNALTEEAFPPKSTQEGAVTYFSNKESKLNSIQVRYGGEKNNLNNFPSRNSVLGHKGDKDFIKFRIRDAVNGKYIIFPALLEGNISDNSSTTPTESSYIGRADKVYVYGSYSRSISFSVNIVATREEEIPIIWEKVNYAKGLVLPKYNEFEDIGGGARPTAPICYLTLGDLFNNAPGLFTAVNLAIPEGSTWTLTDGTQVPHICTLAFEFTYIGKQNPTMTSAHYDKIAEKFELGDPNKKDVVSSFNENLDKLKKLQTAESEKQPELKPRIPGTTNNPFTRADLPNSRIRVGEN